MKEKLENQNKSISKQIEEQKQKFENLKIQHSEEMKNISENYQIQLKVSYFQNKNFILIL